MGSGKNYRMVLDVLKPHEPSILKLTEEIGKLEGVRKVTVRVIEVDANTETIKLTIEGSNLNFEKLKDCIKNMGAVIHSVDEVTLESSNNL